MLTCFLESRKNMRGRKKGEEKRGRGEGHSPLVLGVRSSSITLSYIHLCWRQKGLNTNVMNTNRGKLGIIFISQVQNRKLWLKLYPKPYSVCGGEWSPGKGGALHTHPNPTPCWRQRRIKNTSCSERDKSISIRAVLLTPPWQINIFLHNGVTKAATKSPGNAKQPHKEYRKAIE